MAWQPAQQGKAVCEETVTQGEIGGQPAQCTEQADNPSVATCGPGSSSYGSPSRWRRARAPQS